MRELDGRWRLRPWPGKTVASVVRGAWCLWPTSNKGLIVQVHLCLQAWGHGRALHAGGITMEEHGAWSVERGLDGAPGAAGAPTTAHRCQVPGAALQ